MTEHIETAHVVHLLPGYVVNTLEPAERRDVLFHLSECPACRAELAAWQAIQRALQAPSQEVPREDTVLQQVWRRVEANAWGGEPRRFDGPDVTRPVLALPLPAPRAVPGPPMRALPRRHRPDWLLAQMATAALLVLTLAAGTLVIWQGQHEGREAPTWLPVIIGGSLPAGFSEKTVFTATFAAGELPEEERTAILYDVTLAPGASLPYLAAPTCDFHCEDRELDYGVSQGVGAELVQSGVYTVRLAAPFAVQRSGSAGGPIEVAAQQEVTLGPGDAAIYHDRATPAELRNTGPEPVDLFGVAIVGDTSAGDPLRVPPGVEQGMLTNTIPADWETLPSGPVQVTVRRVTLPAGTSLPPYEPGGLEAIHVESGAIAWSYLRPGQDASDTARVSRSTSATTPFTAAPSGARRILHSVGDDPVVMLVVTIEPAQIPPQSLIP